MSKSPQIKRVPDSDGPGSARVDNALVGRARFSTQVVVGVGMGAREGAQVGTWETADECAQVGVDERSEGGR